MSTRCKPVFDITDVAAELADKYVMVPAHKAANNCSWAYFFQDYSDVHTKYSEVDEIKMLEFLIDNIYVGLSGQSF